MREWIQLNKCFDIGSLKWIDLQFAARVLKTLGSTREDHAALLAVLFALSAQGHLMLDISAGSLETALQSLQIDAVETMAALIRRGAEEFPAAWIADSPEGVPSTWICRRNSHYYLQKNWVFESRILFHIHRLSAAKPTIPDWIPDPRLNEAQQEAVAKAAQSCVFLLSGGPGTGKTFTASLLAHACQMSHPKEEFRIMVTAPTGKAVAQLESSVRKVIPPNAEIVAGTLHALLGIRPSLEEQEVIPLLADIILVDECSMIDVHLFSRLLESVSEGTRLILIGDPDQLPPVEAGSVFADLLDANLFPTTHLSTVLRSDRTEILTLARHIREGIPEISKGIEWIDPKEDPPSQQLAQLWERCKDRFPSFFSSRPEPEQLMGHLRAFGILSCMRQGPLGVDAVNRHFLHQYAAEIRDAWWVLPVMITRNDYELELFNGDLGWLIRRGTPDLTLRSFHPDDEVLFDDRKGGYRRMSASLLTAFEYAYCLSVHKSQGSEYDDVLILFPPGSEQFGREVLYTAVTRARKNVSLWGSRELLERAIGSSSRKRSGIVDRCNAHTKFLTVQE